jgi:hypothetical protein
MLKFANIIRSLYLGDPAELPSLSDIFKNNRYSETIKKLQKMVPVLVEKKFIKKSSVTALQYETTWPMLYHNYHMFSNGDIVSLAAVRLDSYD